MNNARYSIYLSPEPASVLHENSADWFGLTHGAKGLTAPSLPTAISANEWSEVTASARRYGFHATLKPPFRLAHGCTLEQLQASLQSFARWQKAFVCPALTVSQVGGFLALTIPDACPVLEEFAASCVCEFDAFRAAPTKLETAQRLRGSLTERELSNLERWGYPYVLDTWKFHMTLTCSLSPPQRSLFLECLQAQFAEACATPFSVSSICLFEEPEPAANFQLVERFALSA